MMQVVWKKKYGQCFKRAIYIISAALSQHINMFFNYLVTLFKLFFISGKTIFRTLPLYFYSPTVFRENSMSPNSDSCNKWLRHILVITLNLSVEKTKRCAGYPFIPTFLYHISIHRISFLRHTCKDRIDISICIIKSYIPQLTQRSTGR